MVRAVCSFLRSSAPSRRGDFRNHLGVHPLVLLALEGERLAFRLMDIHGRLPRLGPEGVQPNKGTKRFIE